MTRRSLLPLIAPIRSLSSPPFSLWRWERGRGAAVDYAGSITEHEDRRDKELSQLISIIKTPSKSKMEITGGANTAKQMQVHTAGVDARFWLFEI